MATGTNPTWTPERIAAVTAAVEAALTEAQGHDAAMTAGPPAWWAAPTLQDCRDWLDSNTCYEMVDLPTADNETWWHLRLRIEEDEEQTCIAQFCYHCELDCWFAELNHKHFMAEETGVTESDLLALTLCRRIAELYPDGPDKRATAPQNKDGIAYMRNTLPQYIARLQRDLDALHRLAKIEAKHAPYDEANQRCWEMAGGAGRIPIDDERHFMWELAEQIAANIGCAGEHHAQ